MACMSEPKTCVMHTHRLLRVCTHSHALCSQAMTEKAGSQSTRRQRRMPMSDRVELQRDTQPTPPASWRDRGTVMCTYHPMGPPALVNSQVHSYILRQTTHPHSTCLVLPKVSILRCLSFMYLKTQRTRKKRFQGTRAQVTFMHRTLQPTMGLHPNQCPPCRTRR